MIPVTESISIDEQDIQFDYVRSAGPGGQNVNKVSTSVQLRFNIIQASTLEPKIKDRLIKLGGNRVTSDGILIIEAKRYRTQEKNRLDSIKRLVTLIQQAAEEPKIRKKTRPTLTSSAARVDEKKRRGAIKRIRGFNPGEWDE